MFERCRHPISSAASMLVEAGGSGRGAEDTGASHVSRRHAPYRAKQSHKR